MNRNNVESMYSANWFKTFAENYPASWTTLDMEFLTRRLGSTQVKNILDIGCGFGRIAGPLSRLGHTVTAIDASEPAIIQGKKLHPGVDFKYLNMINLRDLQERSFDFVLNLWNSFGYFSKQENFKIILDISNLLVNSGTAIFDLYNPKYLIENLGRDIERSQSECRIVRHIDGDRYTDEYFYKDGTQDSISFEMYHPSDFVGMCRDAGFVKFEILTNWKPFTEISNHDARYQVICEAVR